MRRRLERWDSEVLEVSTSSLPFPGKRERRADAVEEEDVAEEEVEEDAVEEEVEGVEEEEDVVEGEEGEVLRGEEEGVGTRCSQ